MSDEPDTRSSAPPDDGAGALAFLAGGGEMGERMRALDWRATPLGDPQGWPSSLRTTVGILLHSKYPMFLAWGPELAFLYNDGYRPVFGDKHPAALGRPFAQIWPEIWSEIRPLVDRALAGEPTWSENLQLFMERRGFAEECYFTFSYSPVRGDDGAVQGMFCACTETTGEVIGQRRLKFLRDVAAATGDARSVTHVCRAAAEVIGAHAADVPFALIYLRDSAGDTARLLACSGCAAGESFSPHSIRVGDTAAGWPLQPMLPERGGVLRGLDPELGLPAAPWPEAATCAAILPLARGGHDQIRGYLIVGASPRLAFDEPYAHFLDLLASGLASALANAEAHEAERTRAEALAEIDRAKTMFFSNVSHEFRTPLMLILAPLIEVLAADSGLPAPLREPLSVAHRNALRLLKLVNSLLDFSRVEAGRIEAYRPTDLAALTEDLASNFRSACEQAGLRLRVDCAALPQPVYVDRDLWERIVLNLLSNAFKFTLQGTIEVTLRAIDDAAVLRVRDTGSGIPADELPRLFERFHRVEGTRARSHEGSGIGLALVRELVQLHGGRIEAESEPGRGTCMSVSVPFGKVHLPSRQLDARRAATTPGTLAAAYVEEALRWLPDADAGIPGPAELPRNGAAPGVEQARVLVADDNADMRGYLARLLRSHWRVETAADGTQALQAARREPPDLLLTDVMMPGLDGFELIRALRAEQSTAAVPVIMVSARAGEEARLEGLQAGVDDYLVKPFSARELVARVSTQLILARSKREREELLERERVARAAAELERQRLRSVFMQAPAPVVVLRGPGFIVELANELACRVWGRTAHEVIGKPLLTALPELRGQVFVELLEQVYRGGETHIGKEVLARLDWRADGTLQDVYFSFVYAPQFDVHGVIDGVLVIAFDVSEQVGARERINELRRQAEDAGRAKDDFLAMLSHELRNPLAPIMTALELMRLRGDSSFVRERAIIERQAMQLVRLVDDLVDVSRITRGQITLKQESVNLAEVIAQAIEMVNPLLERRRHTLSTAVAPHGLVVPGDAARLIQVVSNLLSNAARYTEPGGRISIQAQHENEAIVVTVRDNGSGIHADLLPRVFDMFAQQRRDSDRSQGGLGLGLSIVRSIVELHGGEIRAYSEGPGRGSQFTVRLPASARARSP